MLTYGVYPGTPLGNIAQVAHSMQKYHNYWADRDSPMPVDHSECKEIIAIDRSHVCKTDRF